MMAWWQWAALFIGLAAGMVLVAGLVFWKISLLLDFRPGTYPVIIKIFGWSGAAALLLGLGFSLMDHDDAPIFITGGVFCLLIAGWCAFFYQRRHPKRDYGPPPPFA